MGKITAASFSAPEPITDSHIINHFDCDTPSLNEWLRKRALRNEAGGASRTFVVSNKEKIVAAYYCLSTGSIVNCEAPGNIRRGMPDPIPVLILGRLAVDTKFQGLGIGKGLLKDAIKKATLAAQYVGIKGVMVHAISEEAQQFYLKNGFIPSPNEPMTLVIGLKNASNQLLGDNITDASR